MYQNIHVFDHHLTHNCSLKEYRLDKGFATLDNPVHIDDDCPICEYEFSVFENPGMLEYSLTDNLNIHIKTALNSKYYNSKKYQNISPRAPPSLV